MSLRVDPSTVEKTSTQSGTEIHPPSSPKRSQTSQSSLFSIQSPRFEDGLAEFTFSLVRKISTIFSFLILQLKEKFKSIFRHIGQYFGFLSTELCFVSFPLPSGAQVISAMIGSKKIENFEMTIQIAPEESAILILDLQCQLDSTEKYLKPILLKLLKENGFHKIGSYTLAINYYLNLLEDILESPIDAVVNIDPYTHEKLINKLENYFKFIPLSEKTVLLWQKWDAVCKKAKETKKEFTYPFKDFSVLLRKANISHFHRSIEVFQKSDEKKKALLWNCSENS